MNYTESKKKIEEIRNKDEVMFRMAISHLMDVGIRHLAEENIKSSCEAIMKQDDSHSIMTNKYQCDLVKMAGELAKIDHIHLLNYISKEVYYDVNDNKLSYSRAMVLLRHCMDWVEEDHCDKSETLDTMEYLGFEHEELEDMGYGYLIEEEE